MMQTELPPMFIKANFTFTIMDRRYSFLNQGVSVFGISGVRWDHFDPAEHVGEQVAVTVDVLSKDRFRFTNRAMITAETTSDATYLGLKFQLGEDDHARLAGIVQREGYYPTNYIRKYPRIPAWSVIPNMPIRAIVRAEGGELIAFDIANMSPNGILLYTENPNAALFAPTTRIQAQVEPRGEIFEPFYFEGLVCRVVLDKNPTNKNITRYLGVRFMRLSALEKENLVAMLRRILNNIQMNKLVTG